MTLTGKVFKSYAEAIIAKHGFGSNKMIGLPKFWDEYIEKFVSDHSEMVAKFEAENTCDSLKGLVGKWEVRNIATDDLKASRQWLIENGYMREWVKRVAFGWAHYYGLTAKGWAVANKYLNAD